jgi:hypothetical protein
MHCLVTASKHINNTQVITRQLLGKRLPVATDMHATVKVLSDYNNADGVFNVVHAD